MDWQELSFPARPGGPSLRARINSLPGGDMTAPVVILLTGDGKKGTKSLSWTNLPPLLARAGMRSYLFDFEGLGYSEGERRSLTLTKGIENLRVAHDFLISKVAPDASAVVGFASSFGAACLLLQPNIANNLKALVLKSPAPFLPQAYFNEVGSLEFNKWIASGYSEINGYDVDVLRDAFHFDVWQEASHISVPCLITHGTEDEIVPFSHSELLRSRLAGDAELEVFHGVGHGYSEEGAWDRMAQKAVSWLSSKLANG